MHIIRSNGLWRLHSYPVGFPAFFSSLHLFSIFPHDQHKNNVRNLFIQLNLSLGAKLWMRLLVRLSSYKILTKDWGWGKIIYCREEIQALMSIHFLLFMCESLQRIQKLEREVQMRILKITTKQQPDNLTFLSLLLTIYFIVGSGILVWILRK